MQVILLPIIDKWHLHGGDRNLPIPRGECHGKNLGKAIQKGVTEGSLHNVLYDRKNDPYQLTNLFSDSKMIQVKEKLLTLIHNRMEKYNDHFWEYSDFMNAASEDEWNNAAYICPVDILK